MNKTGFGKFVVSIKQHCLLKIKAEHFYSFEFYIELELSFDFMKKILHKELAFMI